MEQLNFKPAKLAGAKLTDAPKDATVIKSAINAKTTIDILRHIAVINGTLHVTDLDVLS